MDKFLNCKCKNCKLDFKIQDSTSQICPRCYKKNIKIVKKQKTH